MQDNTWIKLYRKVGKNGILRDHKAWAVFSWLLINVDRESGSRTVGRFQMSDELNIKPVTLYKTLHRLEKKYNFIKLVNGKNRFTEVWIVNWGKYQLENSPSKTIVKTNDNESNTKQEVKNKDILGKPNMAQVPKDGNYGNNDINFIIQCFEDNIGYKPTDRSPRNVAQNIRQLVNSFIKRNDTVYFQLHEKHLTFNSVLERSWLWYMKKDYAKDTERLDTFKLKMKAFFELHEKKMAKEVILHEPISKVRFSGEETYESGGGVGATSESESMDTFYDASTSSTASN